jgi:hypothetical protein
MSATRAVRMLLKPQHQTSFMKHMGAGALLGKRRSMFVLITAATDSIALLKITEAYRAGSFLGIEDIMVCFRH